MEAPQEDGITEEQRKRMEANREAALAKRKALAVSSDVSNGSQNARKLFKCRKLSFEPEKTGSSKPSYPFVNPVSVLEPQLAEKFRVRFEICSPDSFSITPVPLPGFAYPGEEACFKKISLWLSDVLPSHFTQNLEGERASVFKLWEYVPVLRSLRNCEGIECVEIPWGTFRVVETLLESHASGKWKPCRPEYLPDERVNDLLRNLPKKLLDTLMPFQHEGVRFGLRRGGRCLIADEMGLGKTLQAIAIAGCFRHEGSILIICPAILRFSWAEELERWFPFCVPSDIHLVFCRQDNPENLENFPKIVVISYKMLHHLLKSMLQREWATLIVDESHHLRCSKKKSEPHEINAVLNVAMKVKHLILLSGTPSLSRPGLIGRTKFEFAETYCSPKFVPGVQGKVFQDFSKGIRLEELSVLLKQTVMIRRLKQHVLSQLPPIRRQVMRLVLQKSDISSAMAALGLVVTRSESTSDMSSLGALDVDASGVDSDDEPSELLLEDQEKSNIRQEIAQKGDQILGLAKLPGFFEWLSMHPILTSLDLEDATEDTVSSQKMIIFAHHHIVCDRIQEFLMEKGIDIVRINSQVSAIDRKLAVQSFQSSPKVKIAVIGIMAGGVGLNLTAAQNVVFLELPKGISYFNQAEARAHRMGQTSAVNIYIFCAKGTSDESRWQKLNQSLFQVSSVMNGKHAAIPEIKVEAISDFGTMGGATEIPSSEIPADQDPLIQPHDSSKIDYPNLDCGNSSREGMPETSGSIPAHNDIEGDKEKQKACTEVEIELHQNESCEEVEDAGTSSAQVTFLRFEVSQYTGRIHLYSCIPGRDSRPQPLFLSFGQQELESLELLSEDGMKTTTNCEEDCKKYQSSLLLFIKEWGQLRPLEQTKLYGKPLRLPLTVELSYLAESLNHDKKGLLKGGSKRRTTPMEEINKPLPPNASWRMVHLRGSGKKKEKMYKQGWSSMEEPLCKFCQSPCMNINAKTPEYFEDLFCNLECCEEYGFRTKRSGLRQALFQVERGICTSCQLDCHGLVQKLRPLSIQNRQELIRKVAPQIAKRQKPFDKLVQDPTEGNAWHADHIIAVHRGGGECRLENMRTLCISCHADVTAAQCAERRSTRTEARRHLKVAIKNLKEPQMLMEFTYKSENQRVLEAERFLAEKELIVEVPGSAYSSVPQS